MSVKVSGLWLVACISISNAIPFAAASINYFPSGSSSVACIPQEETDEDSADEKKDTVTVRGQLIIAGEVEFDLSTMPVVLDEFQSPPKLPLPDNFSDMTMEQRQNWYGKFIESDAGKKYQEQVEKIQKELYFEQSTADKDGRFVFKDVKRSQYGLYGQTTFTADGKTYLAEFQAEFPIEEKVKFIELDRLPVVVKRVLQTGETALDLKLKSDSQEKDAVHELKQYAGKHVLLYFWSIDSAKLIQAELQKAVDAKIDLKILGINLNQPSETLDQYLSENKPAWDVLKTEGLNGAPVTVDYAVSDLPSLWLVGPDGKIKVTHNQFIEALSAEDADLTETLKQAMAGKKIGQTKEE